MSVPLLELREVDLHYGPVQALRRVSLRVEEGETVCLIGANGAGKSSLLLALFAQPRPSAGRILLAGEEVTGLPAQRIAARGVALVPEGRRVFAEMSVEENLLMGTVVLGERHAATDLRRMYQLFPRLEERRRQRAATLSGGEQQMLAIGRALMGRPRLLLLDEPSMGLAPIVVQQIFRVLRELAAGGMTLFLVEQNAHHALRLSDRGYVLANGAIRLSGSGAELLADPEVRSAYLGA